MQHEHKTPTMSRATAIGLHELAHRRWARVVGLKPAGDAEESEVLLRLLEIGFLPGEPVRVLSRGVPGTDPPAVGVGRTESTARSQTSATPI